MNAIQPIPELDIHDLLDAALLGLGSVESRRQYMDTYQKWLTWCEGRGLHPLTLTDLEVNEFLKAQPVTKVTRQRYLAALRKLVEYLAIHHSGFEVMWRGLKRLKVPTEGTAGKERNKVALTPAQVEKILAYWRDEPDDDKERRIHARKRAMVYCGLATGSRRAEIVALEWRDVNLDEGIIHIRHGKGDKARDATIVGDFGIWALQEWKAIQGDGWQYVFVPINKGGVIGPDKAISADTYYNAVKEVSKVVGFDFATHDLRRSLLTELSRMGARTRDLQAQAGHAHSSTTEKYIQAADAGERRKTFRVRWE